MSRAAGAAQRVPARLLTHDQLGEPRWLPSLAVLTAASLYATLPARFISGSSASAFGVVRWIVPALSLTLLAPLALSAPKRRIVHSLGRRAAALVLIAIVTAANAAAIVLLVHLLLTGARAHARELLRAAVHMWCMNVIVFGLWFWQLDGGGPTQRRSGPWRPDFLFPQAGRAGGLRRVATEVPRLPLRVVHERDRVQPDPHDAAQPVGEDPDDAAIGGKPSARGDGRRARRQHPSIERPTPYPAGAAL
jgi:hypothetical protein